MSTNLYEAHNLVQRYNGREALSVAEQAALDKPPHY